MCFPEVLVAKRLFIGGCADGKVLDVKDDQRWRVPYSLPLLLLNQQDAPALPLAVDVDSYEPMKLMGHENVFTVYCFEGMTGDSVIESLIAGYRTTTKEKRTA